MQNMEVQYNMKQVYSGKSLEVDSLYLFMKTVTFH